MAKAKSRLSADIALLLVAAIWGFSFPIAKNALDHWGDYRLLVLAIRFWIAFALVAPFVLPRLPRRDFRKYVRPSLVTGAPLVFTHSFLFFALALEKSWEIAFIIALSVIFVPLGGLLFSRVRIPWYTSVGIALAVLGLWALERDPGAILPSPDLATGLALLAAIGFAAYILLVDKVRKQTDASGVKLYDALPLVTGQFFVLAVCFSLLAIFVELPRGLPPYNSEVLFAILFLAVVATVIGFAIYNHAARFTSAVHVAFIFTLEPVFAAIGAYFIRKASIDFIGAALIFAAICFTEIGDAFRQSRQDHRESNDEGED